MKQAILLLFARGWDYSEGGGEGGAGEGDCAKKHPSLKLVVCDKT